MSTRFTMSLFRPVTLSVHLGLEIRPDPTSLLHFPLLAVLEKSSSFLFKLTFLNAV